MTFTDQITLVAAGTLLCMAIAAGVLAYHKNRGEVAWGFMTLLFAPIALILLALPKAKLARASA